MLMTRNDHAPSVHPDAHVSVTAHVIGNVQIGAGCYIDAGAVIASSGPPVVVSDEVIVFAGAIIRSTGGASRPAFPVRVGPRTLVSPQCVLTGCMTGRGCYLATGATLLQGVILGDDVRVGIGAIVHATTRVADAARIGMRHIAVPAGDGFVSTADVEEARRLLGAVNFFAEVFSTSDTDQSHLHDDVMTALLDEVRGWRDEQLA
jgi:carbonic anhydrase/acetyltransferase-like protein (isoleucine patch superfamily)